MYDVVPISSVFDLALQFHLGWETGHTTKRAYCMAQGTLLSQCSVGPKQEGNLKNGRYRYVCERAQLCPTLCDPMDYSLPGSPAHGIFQTQRLYWVVISRGSSPPRDWNTVSCVSCMGRQILSNWAAWEAYMCRYSWFPGGLAGSRESACPCRRHWFDLG